MIIAVDLLWVRVGKNGGTESVIRNLLHGFGIMKKHQYILLVASDNADSFREYLKYGNMKMVVCNTVSLSRLKRVIWENTKLIGVMKKNNAELLFSPIYSMPFLYNTKIPCVAVIHDLQALHFPEYFSWFRNTYMSINWKNTIKKAAKVITISNFCKEDIEKNFKSSCGKVVTIYNPINPSCEEYDFSILEKKFDIKRFDYYYTVSSLAKHKNLITLIKAFIELSKEGHSKLLVSGVRVNAGNEIEQFIKDNNLEESIVLTGFIKNEERDCLYKNCKVFLFSSIFEGFGMTPIEAMMQGAVCVISDAASLREVTKDCAIYVENPLDVDEWVEKIEDADSRERKKVSFPEYSVECIAGQYNDVFEQVKCL